MIAMVSSMRCLQSPVRPKCNLGAAMVLLVCTAVTAQAQESGSTTAQPNEHRTLDTVKFLTGAGAALVLHEGGHLTFDVIFDAQPRLEGVQFGPFPFVAVTHRSGLSPRREFTISSAGFWVQEGTDEWLLNPDRCGSGLRACEGAWFSKGMLAFNVLNSVGYALVTVATPFSRPMRPRSLITFASIMTTSPGRTGRLKRTRSMPAKNGRR